LLDGDVLQGIFARVVEQCVIAPLGF